MTSTQSAVDAPVCTSNGYQRLLRRGLKNKSDKTISLREKCKSHMT